MHSTLYDASASAWINELLAHAIKTTISDIHIEPYHADYRVRLRRDGLLMTNGTLTSTFAAQIHSHLKILAHLDIAEKRLPQDGRLTLSQHPTIDIRLHTCPTIGGEKMVLRLLYAKHAPLTIQNLGMTETQQQLFIKYLSEPQGLILITGPTGSGKTMTLYAALQWLNHETTNIITIEDPIEITLPGIQQINIHPRIGLTFSALLRAILRQDPDIIMIGEIRDPETARIAVTAAETGHLVLATLHTSEASATSRRLKTLGIAEEQIKQLKPLILAQRLLRQCCPDCCAQKEPCAHCYQGYKGRIGLFECLEIANVKTNTLTLREAGLLKVKKGLTTIAELIRVLGPAK